jgi:hypothetical protein
LVDLELHEITIKGSRKKTQYRIGHASATRASEDKSKIASRNQYVELALIQKNMTIAIYISFLAILISVYSAYMTWLKPFKPRFIIGNINIIPAKGSGTMIGIKIVIHNMGSRIGLIEDFMIRVKNDKTDFNSIWFPLMEYDHQKLLENKLQKKGELSSMTTDFTPFFLNSKSTITKEMLFAIDRLIGKLSEGNYTFSFYCKYKNRFNRIAFREEKIEQLVIKELNEKTIMNLQDFAYRSKIAL